MGDKSLPQLSPRDSEVKLTNDTTGLYLLKAAILNANATTTAITCKLVNSLHTTAYVEDFEVSQRLIWKFTYEVCLFKHFGICVQ